MANISTAQLEVRQTLTPQITTNPAKIQPPRLVHHHYKRFLNPNRIAGDDLESSAQQARQNSVFSADHIEPARAEGSSNSVLQSNALTVKVRLSRIIIPNWATTMFRSKRAKLPDGRDSRLVKKNLGQFPKGYPRFSAYIDSDNDTALFRRFGQLHARTLLYKEVELTDLEDQLKKLDEDDAGVKGVGNNWRIRHSIHLDNGYENQKRRDLMLDIESKLKQYDELLLKDAQLRKLQRPSKRVHRNFMDFLVNEHPFEDDDQRFVYHEHDFVTIEEYEESWFDNLMHRITYLCRNWPFKHIFVTAEDRAKSHDPHLRYYSETRLETLTKIIIAFVPTALLLVPIFLFIKIRCSASVMTLITLIFAFLFAVAVSTFTSAKRHEVFGATAAYCAVLVVFIGNLQQRQWDA